MNANEQCKRCKRYMTGWDGGPRCTSEYTIVPGAPPCIHGSKFVPKEGHR